MVVQRLDAKIVLKLQSFGKPVNYGTFVENGIGKKLKMENEKPEKEALTLWFGSMYKI